MDTMERKLSYEGYRLVWQDDFSGGKLNLNDWNIELHEPGWVNNELQEYTASAENIYIENDKLVLKAVKKPDGSYTSGRVSTQWKRDFTYGIFEARLKVPKGKGYLPAFWLMTTDEETYGQWPRCGEIDIMEVLGHYTTTNYGTIHFGIPHKQSQGIYTLENGSFSDEFHVFALKWERDRLSWYVDGNLMFTETDWYCARKETGAIPYPAPFNHPFYIILNLAVGGNWPGDPDENTNFEKEALIVDYVKVYQESV